jgi:tetratricopeptide (TPR) repeat protein
MAAPLSVEVSPAGIIQNLSALSATKQGLAAYYRSLLASSDDLLRAAAMSALLELKAIRPSEWETAVELARFGAVRARAFDYFMGIYDYEMVERILALSVPETSALQEQRRRAVLNLDNARLLEIDTQLFFAEGSLDHLHNARTDAEQLGGWQRALPWTVRCVLAQPGDPRGPYTLLNTLLNANQLDLLTSACRLFNGTGIYPSESAIFSSFVLMKQAQVKDAQRLLQQVPLNALDPRLTVMVHRARAEAFEKLGDFRQAYAAYQRQNTAAASKDIDPDSYPRAVLRHALFKIEAMAPDEHAADHLVMLGFPRSGTTLLENALAAHPAIETVEELPALASAINYLELRPAGDGKVTLKDGNAARARYYREIERHRVKSTAKVVIDKMPLHTAEVQLLERLFPQRRYIFSIRHPYDVILSCFKQLFKPNAAMENFRTIEGACRLYDFVMSRWFAVFSLENSDRVHYVRYEQLVEEFETTVKGVLEFAGLEWDNSIMSFAERAGSRPTRTPSYQKVRGGLAIGVQSTRQGYAFLFGRPETKPLDRWVEHFGYEK